MQEYGNTHKINTIDQSQRPYLSSTDKIQWKSILFGSVSQTRLQRGERGKVQLDFEELEGLTTENNAP